jgi:hypothetical protein
MVKLGFQIRSVKRTRNLSAVDGEKVCIGIWW